MSEKLFFRARIFFSSTTQQRTTDTSTIFGTPLVDQQKTANRRTGIKKRTAMRLRRATTAICGAVAPPGATRTRVRRQLQVEIFKREQSTVSPLVSATLPPATSSGRASTSESAFAYIEKPIPFSTLYGLPNHEHSMPQVAAYVRQELLARLSHRAAKLDAMPLFAKSRSVVAVRRWYETSVRELEGMPAPSPVPSPAWEAMFARFATSFLTRHASTMMTMFKGAYELRALTKQVRLWPAWITLAACNAPHHPGDPTPSPVHS